jgi:hypothetical protein
MLIDSFLSGERSGCGASNWLNALPFCMFMVLNFSAMVLL